MQMQSILKSPATAQVFSPSKNQTIKNRSLYSLFMSNNMETEHSNIKRKEITV